MSEEKKKYKPIIYKVGECYCADKEKCEQDPSYCKFPGRKAERTKALTKSMSKRKHSFRSFPGKSICESVIEINSIIDKEKNDLKINMQITSMIGMNRLRQNPILKDLKEKHFKGEL